MDLSAVQEDVVRPVGPVGAVVAPEGLDSGVNLQVLLQLVGHVELFVAEVAGELLGLVVRRPDVGDEAFPVVELFAALVAHDCRRAALVVVLGKVDLELVLEGEPPPALGAKDVVGDDVVVALEVKRHRLGLAEHCKKNIRYFDVRY